MTGKGWVAAGDLVVGDEVYALSGDTGTVTGLRLEKTGNPIPVYNLEVEDFQSYFVGDGVLVHNQCNKNRYKTPRLRKDITKPADDVKRLAELVGIDLRPYVDETPVETAHRILRDKLHRTGYATGPGSLFIKLKNIIQDILNR